MHLIPNLITVSRLVLGVLFFMLYPKHASPLILLGALSDVLDGFIARAFHMTSKLGEILDPIVDKIFWILVILKLYLNDIIPAWFISIILIRDMIFFAAFLYMLYKKIDRFKATWSGKLTAVVVGSTIFISLHETCPFCMYRLYVLCVGMIIVNILDYYKRVFR
ncbi:CDP-alcohol phosphatidyltransferase family protein [Candidatus Cytomitobacter primus]|uniref:CDP-diacylglycerol--glycerol-3-phosphate 3-phosphatidyltransferase n=1 Tax=Candidatus Cytomitobacter primus TaxID=2066024 RepID=A0A5C0UF36_9PROT|nr:CDP-alcohol phosphatidyltransferase family protein [Candidatus Cytomitobacter primus]QEK38668.1 CDP-alcohol phosphatidyltransferase family protein [Candidatus Cytomitobacter primus]